MCDAYKTVGVGACSMVYTYQWGYVTCVMYTKQWVGVGACSMMYKHRVGA